MRLHDRHLLPVSGVHGLLGVKYHVHQDEDPVDDSDFSLADEGEAKAHSSRVTRPPKNRKLRNNKEKDEDSVSSEEDGSFFKTHASTLASGEVLLQQLSFESDSLQPVVVLKPSPRGQADMLMSDDEDEDDIFDMRGPNRVEVSPLPVLGLDTTELLDDNSSTMSSLLGEEHLFMGRTESNLSLPALGAASEIPHQLPHSDDSIGLEQEGTPDQPLHNNNGLFKALPPIPSILSTGTFSSDEYGHVIRKDMYPLVRSRERIDSTTSMSSLVFNYSDGEASFAPHGDPKSLLHKRRPVRVDPDEVGDCTLTTNSSASFKKKHCSENSASGSSIPDNDIPAIKSLASVSSKDSKIDLATHRSSPSLHPLPEKDLLLDDIDWEAPMDNGFTTVDTPPFFTISIPKNWKQQEENTLKKKKKKNGLDEDISKKAKNRTNNKSLKQNPRERSIEFRVAGRDSKTEPNPNRSGTSKSRSDAKSKTVQNQKETQRIKTAKISLGDDNRSVSSNQTFWSTQSDGLLAQRHHHSRKTKKTATRSSSDKALHEETAQDDKSEISKYSFSSFRSFFSSKSWKNSKRRPKPHRRPPVLLEKEKRRWTWLWRIFGSDKNKNLVNKMKNSVPTTPSMEEDMTNPTAELSEVSFLSHSINETFQSDTGVVSPRRIHEIGDGIKPPKPNRQNSGPITYNGVDSQDTMIPVDHTMKSTVMIYQVSQTSTQAHYPHLMNSGTKAHAQSVEVGDQNSMRSPVSILRKDAETTQRVVSKKHGASEPIVQVTVSSHKSCHAVSSSNQSPTDGSSLKFIQCLDYDIGARVERRSRSAASPDPYRVVSAQKLIANHSSPIPKPPGTHHRCSSVGSSRSVLSSSSRGSVYSNDSGTSRGSAQDKMSVHSMNTTNTRTTNVSASNSIRSVPRRGNESTSHSRQVSMSSTQSLNSVRSPVSPSSKRSIASSGSSVVSKGSYTSNSSTISRNSSSAVSRKSHVSQGSAQSWSSRGSLETVRDPCARPSKIVRKSSHLQQLTEKGDGDVWIEKLYKSKRTGEYKVYFVSTNTGKRSRDEPPSGASKVIYRDFDVRFK